LILLPIGFHSNILLGILRPSIRITCPTQFILLLLMNLTMCAFLMSSFNSWFFLLLQIPLAVRFHSLSSSQRFSFYGARMSALRPTPNLEHQGIPFRLDHHP
jgi:hypothetical protein